MAEAEALFELLHWEIVGYLHSSRDAPVKVDADSTLDQIGFRVGQSIIERLTKDYPRFRDELEMVKYLCKDFWGQLYKKQIDNLRTNRQGVYVLQDNNFRILSRISSSEQYKDEARRFLSLPAGILRGALYGLGYNSQVTAEVTGMPACQFKLVLQR